MHGHFARLYATEKMPIIAGLLERASFRSDVRVSRAARPWAPEKSPLFGYFGGAVLSPAGGGGGGSGGSLNLYEA